jgi:hypothetical protein
VPNDSAFRKRNNDGPNHLSSGNQKRVDILAALTRKPEDDDDDPSEAWKNLDTFCNLMPKKPEKKFRGIPPFPTLECRFKGCELSDF